MSTAIEAAFDEWYGTTSPNSTGSVENMVRYYAQLAFAAGISHAAKANTELIKEYQETMEKIDEEQN